MCWGFFVSSGSTAIIFVIFIVDLAYHNLL